MDKEYLELVNKKKELNSEISELNSYIGPIRYFVNVVEHPILISPLDKSLKEVNSFSALFISSNAPFTYS